jgi:predicted  nucleic acid-binding Zn-ribbon protein
MQAAQLERFQDRRTDLQRELQPLKERLRNYNSDIANNSNAVQVLKAEIEIPTLTNKMRPLIDQFNEVSVIGQPTVIWRVTS